MPFYVRKGIKYIKFVSVPFFLHGLVYHFCSFESVVLVTCGLDRNWFDSEIVFTLGLSPQIAYSDGIKISRSDTTGIATGTLVSFAEFWSSVFVIVSFSIWVEISVESSVNFFT